MILGKPSKMHICFHHLMTMKWIETANKPTIHSIHSTPGHKPTTCRRPVIQLRSLWRVQLKLEQRWGYGISMEGRMTMAHSLIPIYIRPRPSHFHGGFTWDSKVLGVSTISGTLQFINVQWCPSKTIPISKRLILGGCPILRHGQVVAMPVEQLRKAPIFVFLGRFSTKNVFTQLRWKESG